MTRAQLDAFIASAAAATAPSSQGGSGAASDADTEAPTISINGNNPATINVGDNYVDLGASISDNVDQNLGYSASVDGGTATTDDQVVIDTSASGTHTIEYSATDAAGNTGTATRTVDVVDPTPTPAPEPTQEPTPEPAPEPSPTTEPAPETP